MSFLFLKPIIFRIGMELETKGFANDEFHRCQVFRMHFQKFNFFRYACLTGKIKSFYKALV